MKREFSVMKRLLKKVFAASCLIAVATGLLSCSVSGSREPVTKSGTYFDTLISITVYDRRYSDEVDHCFSMADRFDRLFSMDRKSSDIWKINHAEGQPVKVSDDTVKIIQEGLKYSAMSDGTFDITVGRLTQVWEKAREKKKIPSADRVKEALSTVDYRNVEIDGNKVTLKNPNAMIDLGAIAKGYIADSMKSYLVKHHVPSALINLGGNVLVVKDKPDGSPYRIGIQEPFASEGTAVTEVAVSDKSVVTSGIYERYFKKDGKIYHHILDTASGYPEDNGIKSVTVISKKSVDGDALSTMLFVLGPVKGIEKAEKMDGIECAYILSDGSFKMTSGMKKYGFSGGK